MARERLGTVWSFGLHHDLLTASAWSCVFLRVCAGDLSTGTILHQRYMSIAADVMKNAESGVSATDLLQLVGSWARLPPCSRALPPVCVDQRQGFARGCFSSASRRR